MKTGDRWAAVDSAIVEAARFLDKAKIVRRQLETNADFASRLNSSLPIKDVASMKRASLDLTRALAELRRRG